MEKFRIPLLIHGEVNDKNVDIFDREKKFIEHQFRKNRSEEKSKQIRRSLSIEIENKLEAEMQGINKVKVN